MSWFYQSYFPWSRSPVGNRTILVARNFGEFCPHLLSTNVSLPPIRSLRPSFVIPLQRSHLQEVGSPIHRAFLRSRQSPCPRLQLTPTSYTTECQARLRRGLTKQSGSTIEN